MNNKYKYIFYFLIFLTILSGILMFLFRDSIAVLNPKGPVALQERNIIVISVLLMLIVVIPVLIIPIVFGVKYRASNKNAKYDPNWDYNFWVEAIWWGIPCVIIFILSLLTFTSSHALNPFKPIESNNKPLTIQVVALQWRWLFLYPEQQIASLNFFQFPENTPVRFEITADAPMNSFWIPQLAGQIYAMPGMNTQLHLVANEPGEYRGSSANLSGKGFAHMWFTAKASTEEEFQAWVREAKNSKNSLTSKHYAEMAKPNEKQGVELFALTEPKLYEKILMKYMPHATTE